MGSANIARPKGWALTQEAAITQTPEVTGDRALLTAKPGRTGDSSRWLETRPHSQGRLRAYLALSFRRPTPPGTPESLPFSWGAQTLSCPAPARPPAGGDSAVAATGLPEVRRGAARCARPALPSGLWTAA